MAIVADNFLLPERQPENHTTTPLFFPRDQGLCSDLAWVSSQSCDGVDMWLPFSKSNALSSQESPQFLFRDLGDLINRCGEPVSSHNSPPSVTQKMGSFHPEMDTAELRLNELGDSISFEDSTGDNELLFQSTRPQPTPEITEISPRASLRESDCNAWLSPEEECRLRRIATPTESHPVSPPPSLSPSLSPSPQLQPQDTRGPPKRKSESSQPDFCPQPRSRRRSSTKTAHNVIEKRYRTNLNDRITALREMVPSLRGSGEDFLEDPRGLSPAQKLNKATILVRAADYIAQLEKWNEGLAKEKMVFKARINALERLVTPRSGRDCATRGAATDRLIS